MRAAIVALAGVALVLASCGKPDASGIYLAASDRKVILIQIIETKDGTLTGRLEEVSVDASGKVSDRTIPLDGAASNHDLMFKPASAWFGGLQATGNFTSDRLTLTGSGTHLEAARSSLDNYQAALAHLQSVAANDRQQIANAQAARARQTAQAQALKDADNKVTAIRNATVRLRDDTARMNTGIADSPNFTQQSAANTARIAKMLQVAPTLSDIQRNQLIVNANQIEVGTNQIEVARSQYAIELNQIVQDAGPLAEQVLHFCDSPQGSQFATPCGPAKAAAMEFRASLMQGQKAFLGHKQAVQEALNQQAALIRRMNGN